MSKRYHNKRNIYKYLFYLLLVINFLIIGYVFFESTTIRSLFIQKFKYVLGFNNSPEGDYLYGIDISEYQGVVNWNNLASGNNNKEIEFVMIRSTAGKDHRDRYFTSNWREVKKRGLTRAAYHYYRPDEKAVDQAEFFIKNVSLNSGDLPPILDIEKIGNGQSVQSLKIELQIWLETVERHYGIKPIIYSGAHFYNKYLFNEFSDYVLWIANYNKVKNPLPGKKWIFWQYTDEGLMQGIKGPVDLDVFKGDRKRLNELILK